jgi:ABC-2 type transport system permease protein
MTRDTAIPAMQVDTPRPVAGLVREARTAVRVMGAMVRLSMIESRRYAFNTLMRVVLSYAFFFMVFMGAWATLGNSSTFGQSLSGIVVAMTIWFSAFRAFTDLANRLTSEATQGTLEQLAMSPIGLGRVLVYQTLAQMVVQLMFVLLLLVLMMATTGRWLHLDVVSLVPLLLLSMLAVQGVGFAMGGLTLVFKRIGATFTVFQYIFLTLVAVPLDKVPALRYLPLSWGARLIRRVMVDGVPIWRMPAGDLLFLAANGVFWFALGFAAFKGLERVARERGMLGHY